VGGRRSFGEHFLPPEGAEALDATQLGGEARALESDADGLWVRAPGATTFERLARLFPGHLPWHPPTGDRITLAGALSACTHDAVGFFANDVRAFTLVTPDGRAHHCAAEAPGLEGELFRHLPGSFGALGVVIEVELRLRRVLEAQRAEINVLDKCARAEVGRALDGLEAIYQRGEYPLGRGIFLFGRRGEVVLLGDRLVVPRPGERVPPLPLTNDALAKNVYLQAIANRFPAPTQRLLPHTFRKGQRFHAKLYPFLFFQRSYDRAYEVLSAEALLPRLLRRAGFDPRLTVCHTTFAIPAAACLAFIELYQTCFDAFPETARRLENQDIVRLPPCPWPLHGTYGMREGAYLFSPSFSVRRGSEHEGRVRALLAEVGRRAFEALGVKVLLLKQVHLDPAALARMHRPFIEALGAVRARADPEGRLTSRLLERLDDLPG